LSALLFCFFFQAEDGIRDKLVTGVQTCALPIFDHLRLSQLILMDQLAGLARRKATLGRRLDELGAAGCLVPQRRKLLQAAFRGRSEERRVGKECRSRWWAEQ